MTQQQVVDLFGPRTESTASSFVISRCESPGCPATGAALQVCPPLSAAQASLTENPPVKRPCPHPRQKPPFYLISSFRLVFTALGYSSCGMRRRSHSARACRSTHPRQRGPRRQSCTLLFAYLPPLAAGAVSPPYSVDFCHSAGLSAQGTRRLSAAGWPISRRGLALRQYHSFRFQE